MKKHNYPKDRRPKSNTDYAKSTQLIMLLGKEKLSEIFSHKGMYLASKEISEMTGTYYSPAVIKYTRDHKLK
jgi:hypothetical protein